MGESIASSSEEAIVKTRRVNQSLDLEALLLESSMHYACYRYNFCTILSHWRIGTRYNSFVRLALFGDRKCNHGRKKPLVSRQATLCKYLDINGLELDSGVFIAYPENGSFTNEAMLEIMPHGNPLIIQKIRRFNCPRLSYGRTRRIHPPCFSQWKIRS